MIEDFQKEDKTLQIEEKLREIIAEKIKKFANQEVTERNCFLTCFSPNRKISSPSIKDISFIKKTLRVSLIFIIISRKSY